MQRQIQEIRRQRAVSNPLTDMVSLVKTRNSSIITEASTRYLKIETNAGPTPEHVKVTFYTITRLFENPEDPHIEIMWNTLNPDNRPETPEDLYELQLNNPMYLAQSLFKLYKLEKSEFFTTLMIANSLMNTLSPTFLASFNEIVDRQQSERAEISLTVFLAIYPSLASVNPFDLTRFWNLNAGHYMFGYSLFFTLIGKSLNSNNYTGWMTQRTRSFSRPLGLSEKDPKFALLRPTLTMCNNFYSEVRVFWEIRSLYFGSLWAMSKGVDLRAQGCRVAVALLRNAELTNFNLILMWIVSINDILLGWNELGKYHPYICAAYAKYLQLGEMAPWGKLILPPEEVQEFAADKLIVPFTVARALSAKYGSATANQIEGVTKNATVEKIVSHALKIVSIAGGARTIDVMSIRAWKLNGYENKELIQLLDQGALEGDVEETEVLRAIDVGERI